MATVSKNKVDLEIKKEISEYMDSFKKADKSFSCNGMRLVVTTNQVSDRKFYIGCFFVKKEDAKKDGTVKNIDNETCKIVHVF